MLKLWTLIGIEKLRAEIFVRRFYSQVGRTPDGYDVFRTLPRSVHIRNYVNNCTRDIWNSEVLSSAPLELTGGRLTLPSAQRQFEFLRRPSSFTTRSNWILFWIMAMSSQQLINSITRQNANETTHNGSIIGQIYTNAWWLDGLEDYYNRHSHEMPNLAIGDMQRGRLEPLLGADFMLVYGIDSDRVKIAFFQAKSLNSENRFSVSQTNRITGRRQIDDIMRLERILVRACEARRGLVGPRLPPRFALFDSACFYVGWDRATWTSRNALPPVVRSARGIRGQIPAAGPYTANPWIESMDFAALTSLFLCSTQSLVGVTLRVSKLVRMFNLLRRFGGFAFPRTVAAIGLPSTDWTPHRWIGFLQNLGYQTVNTVPLVQSLPSRDNAQLRDNADNAPHLRRPRT